MRPTPRSARRLLPVALVCCCFWTVLSQAEEKHASYSAALESIRPGEFKQHVDYLADDKLEGREAGRRGGRLAADYLMRQLKGFDLSGAGVNGGFFQPFSGNYRNVLAMRRGSHPKLKNQAVIVAAHYDHVGYGSHRNSRGPVGYIHNGADDNASGTSALLELAQAFSILVEPPKRSVVFLFFDAEEKGLLGSQYWNRHPTIPLEDVKAMVNMDMVGRLRKDRLTVFGTRTGYGWRRLVCRHNEQTGLLLNFSWDIKANADHYPFFKRNVPILLLHTGRHNEYHSPRDDAKLINSGGASRVARLLFPLVYDLADGPQTPRFRRAGGRETERTRKRLAAGAPKLPDRLGVTFERRPSKTEGVRLLRIVPGSPAEGAKLRVGDRIVRFAGREVRTGDDLSGAVRAAKNPAIVAIRRADQEEPLELTVKLDDKPMRLGLTWRVDPAEPGTIILARVVPGTPAARAGLRVGDRIYQIAGRDFADDAEFAKLAKTLPGPLQLLVERDGKLRTVVLHFQNEPLKRAA